MQIWLLDNLTFKGDEFLDYTLHQAYFFTDFPATTETGISETLSLGKKFLSLAEKIVEFDLSAENSLQ